jgi:transposase-like protein
MFSCYLIVLDKGRDIILNNQNLFSKFALPLNMTMKLEDIYIVFPDEDSCIKFLEDIVWNNHPVCPYCRSINFTPLKNSYRYHCNECNTSYSVTVNTIFHKTKIPLQKWFYIIYLKEINELNISVRILGEEMEITKDTANRIINKVNNFYYQNKELFNSIYSKITKNE